jgi:hypothetical protein
MWVQNNLRLIDPDSLAINDDSSKLIAATTACCNRYQYRKQQKVE